MISKNSFINKVLFYDFESIKYFLVKLKISIKYINFTKIKDLDSSKYACKIIL